MKTVLEKFLKSQYRLFFHELSESAIIWKLSFRIRMQWSQKLLSTTVKAEIKNIFSTSCFFMCCFYCFYRGWKEVWNCVRWDLMGLPKLDWGLLFEISYFTDFVENSLRISKKTQWPASLLFLCCFQFVIHSL